MNATRTLTLQNVHPRRPAEPRVPVSDRPAHAPPASVHIPLDELRARCDELPRDRGIVVHCHSGQRSYFACRLLAQRGFRVRNLTGSWRTWKMATGA